MSVSAKLAVQRAMKATAYRPSVVARSLARGVFSSIQLVMADIRNPVYLEMARGVQDVARDAGYMVDFGNTDDSPERELEYVRTAKAQRFAGVMLLSAAGGKGLRQALEALDCPVLLLNRRVRGFRGDAVVLDNERGGALATSYLIGLGHKRIWHLAGFRGSSASMGRLAGFRQAMREAGLEIRLDAVGFGDLRMESGEGFGRRLVDAGLPCTAVFAANDLMAIGILKVFSARGVRVPEDVSLIGFDDMPFSSLPGIWLTTVRQPQYEMGRAAARMLIERIQNPRVSARTVTFPPEFVSRKTCAAPRE